MTDKTGLGPGAEFDAIRDLVARLGDSAHGIGDDAAVLDVPRGDRLVISTDATIENRHFRSGWITPREIGYRAVTAALSDLAAMAAHPVAVLWSLNLPDHWREHLPALTEGARDAARAANAKIAGGNLASAGELSITTTVVGSVFEPMRRAGAVAGNKLYVTGKLGGPGLALAALSSGRKPAAADRDRFARPAARLAEARWLADHGATAGLDVSDGLAGDARHLAAASNVGLTIHLDLLPCVEGADAVTAARSGEEYELLVAAPELDTADFLSRFALPLTEIGEVVAGQAVTFMDHGRPANLGSGHDHFASQ
jgi:thiamine-monophosphate kinase